jgi:hypothetical protein
VSRVSLRRSKGRAGRGGSVYDKKVNYVSEAGPLSPSSWGCRWNEGDDV